MSSSDTVSAESPPLTEIITVAPSSLAEVVEDIVWPELAVVHGNESFAEAGAPVSHGERAAHGEWPVEQRSAAATA
jgi:hypothetical protein